MTSTSRNSVSLPPLCMKFVGLCKDAPEEEEYKRFQLPIVIEEMRTMIVEFSDPLKFTERYAKSAVGVQRSMSQKQFMQRVCSLDAAELQAAFCVDSVQFQHLLSTQISCVGCRRSVEKLHADVGSLALTALGTMSISAEGTLTIAQPKMLSEPKLLYDFLIQHGNRFRAVVDGLTKCRKNNKRCQLHVLDFHAYKTKATWTDLFHLMSGECKDECCIIETENLQDMLDAYLQKHRFCPDCRTKVLRAYHLLIGEVTPDSEPSYKAPLYQGLHYCSSEKHLHLKACDKFLNALVARAEPEILGGIRERHAKTIEIAQGEVVTCLGLYMYDRLHRIVAALRNLDQTFHLLYGTALIALQNNFQLALEAKFGLMSRSLESLCPEWQTESASVATPAVTRSGSSTREETNGMEQTKAKKKAKKTKQKNEVVVSEENGSGTMTNGHALESEATSDSPPPKIIATATDTTDRVSTGAALSPCAKHHRRVRDSDTDKDAGYVSTSPTSPEPRPQAKAAAQTRAAVQVPAPKARVHAGPPLVDRNGACSCAAQSLRAKASAAANWHAASNACACAHPTSGGSPRQRYQGVLNGHSCCDASDIHSTESDSGCFREVDDPPSVTDDAPVISPEDIRWFSENRDEVSEKRLALREKLKARFDEMQMRMQMRKD